MKNVVVPKVKPQLVRKRAHIVLPKTVKVVVDNKDAKVAVVGGNRQPAQRKVVSKKPPPPQQNQVRIQSAVAGQNVLGGQKQRRKKVKVKYINREVPQNEVIKAQKLRAFGVDKVLLIIGNGPS